MSSNFSQDQHDIGPRQLHARWIDEIELTINTLREEHLINMAAAESQKLDEEIKFRHFVILQLKIQKLNQEGTNEP